MTLKKGKWRALRNFPVSWLHQSMRYMDRSELVFHLSLNVLLWTGFYFALEWTANLNFLSRLIFSGICARTTNFVFNDHFCELVIFSFDGFTNGGRKRIARYLEESSKRLAGCESIYASTVYGSISRGKFHDRSDLDIQYVRRPGFLNAVFALGFAARERGIALFSWIPLDLYVGDSEEFLDKMRADEIPVVLKNDDGRISEKYPDSVPLEKFLREFVQNEA